MKPEQQPGDTRRAQVPVSEQRVAALPLPLQAILDLLALNGITSAELNTSPELMTTASAGRTWRYQRGDLKVLVTKIQNPLLDQGDFTISWS